MSILAGIGSVLGGLGGLFGSKPKAQKQLTPFQAMESQVKGARQHSEEYGFNPLTLLQFGATQGFGAGGSSGSAPPLASIAAITDGLKDISDVTSGDAARRRQADQLEIDMAKIRLDQARSGVDPSAIGSWAASRSPGPLTGNRAATVVQPAARVVPARFSQGENPVAPGRKDDIAPLTNSPGVFEIENRVTGNKPITIPGEGEPWGLDELATAAIVGVPQIVGNIANGYVFGGKSVTDWWKDNKQDRENRAEEEKKRKPDPAPSPSWETGNFPQSPYYR